MEIQIELSELRKRKIFVATPMYGGQCDGTYTNSSVSLARLAQQYDVDVKFYYIFNESLITRARNYCVDEFLRSDSTHMLFIDSDIGFDPNDVFSLAALMDHEDKENGKHIMCGPYPKKTIAWEKIVKAVKAGVADKNPNVLENFVGDYVFNLKDKDTQIRLDEPVRVSESGTGFMMITRHALEKFREKYPRYSYIPDHARSEHFDGSRKIHMYFQALIDNKTKRYLSEDYMFCRWMSKAGIDTWLCPWMKLKHNGHYSFGGSLADIASIGAKAGVGVIENKK